MELYQLRQFQAAARHKNMTRAASELCIAQPALSKTIHKLEEEFGAQLFIRNKKGLECTRQGEILLEYADRILALSEDAARYEAVSRQAPLPPACRSRGVEQRHDERHLCPLRQRGAEP